MSAHNLRHHGNNFSEVLGRGNKSDVTDNFFTLASTLSSAMAGNAEVVSSEPHLIPIMCKHCPSLS